MRFKNMNIGKLFEGYVRDNDGELWVNDEQDEALTQEYRMKSLNYLDKREEEFLYHSFFAEMGLPNKFEPGVARIVSDMQFGESMKHMLEIMNLRRIIIILNDIQSECEKYDLLTADFEKCDKLQFIRFKKENRESDAAMMHRGGLEIPASDLKEIAHFHKIFKNYAKMDKLLKSEE